MTGPVLFGFTLYELFGYFIFYSFLGWCMEVAYAAVDTGKFVNRGFLNGPFCPIYGFGIVLVLMVLTPIKGNLPMLFIGSFLLTTVLEYITGLVLEKFFHNKWWDYSGYPFNIQGYVCLKFSLAWGAACVVVIRLIHPVISGIIRILPVFVGTVLGAVILAVILIDFAATIKGILKLNAHLKELDEISLMIRQQTDALGGNISSEILELKHKYEKIAENRRGMVTRLLKAFPDLKSKKYTQALEDIKQKLKRK